MNLFEQAKPEPKPAAPKPAIEPRDAVSYQGKSGTSRAGAADAVLTGKAADQMTRYITELCKAGPKGLTDHEAAEKLGIPVTSVCARRGSKHGRKYIVDSGTRRVGPTGVGNTVWVHVLKAGGGA